MKILIHQRNNKIQHSTVWNNPWIEYCKKSNLGYEVIDLFQIESIDVIRKFDVLLWHFGGYVFEDMLEARSLLNVAESLGLKVFPGFKENWHFDDKIAEMYALQSVNAPIPASKVFYDIETFNNWLRNNTEFPVVAKLRTGSGSHNVKLFKHKSALQRYASRMFGRGYDPSPSLLYKTSSNIRSSHNKATFISKFKRIPEFLFILKNAKKFPNEKGYVYLQEFVPNDGYDMKVVVVGDKLSGVVRPVRSHDFRASGGGEVFFDKKYFTKEIIQSAFRITDELGMQCIGYDYVVNKQTGEALIVEMSYGFSHMAILSAQGYFDRDCVWHDEPLNVPFEILENIIKK
ncbi:MAG: hypothetical protein RB289_09535 [Paludibacter sp.]|jgi:glutathione synthase/RimK-type ligase-like ATP-grasp enzyme|nr:hypothetical protein [Paludibacter sp.]